MKHRFSASVTPASIAQQLNESTMQTINTSAACCSAEYLVRSGIWRRFDVQLECRASQGFNDLLIAQWRIAILGLNQIHDRFFHAGVAHRFPTGGLIAGRK